MDNGVSFFNIWNRLGSAKGQSRSKEKNFILCKAAIFRGGFLKQPHPQKLLRKFFIGNDMFKEIGKTGRKAARSAVVNVKQTHIVGCFGSLAVNKKRSESSHQDGKTIVLFAQPKCKRIRIIRRIYDFQ